MALITTNEAAKRAGVTVRTLYRWRDAGKLTPRGKHGRTELYDLDEVELLARRKTGAEPAHAATIEEVYIRLSDADEWEDVVGIVHDLAASIALTATDEKDRDLITEAWEAACGMAATSTDEGTVDRFTTSATKYASWLGYPSGRTAEAIAARKADPSFTHEAAVDLMRKAPRDPALTIAKRAVDGR